MNRHTQAIVFFHYIDQITISLLDLRLRLNSQVWNFPHFLLKIPSICCLVSEFQVVWCLVSGVPALLWLCCCRGWWWCGPGVESGWPQSSVSPVCSVEAVTSNNNTMGPPTWPALYYLVIRFHSVNIKQKTF